MPFYIRILNSSMLLLSIIHLTLGFIVSKNQFISTYWGLGILFYGIIHIIRNKNRFEEASIFSAYIVGLEVLLRTVGASVLWEFGKYSAILLLITGILVEGAKHLRINTLSVLYILCLLPSIYIIPDNGFTQLRFAISGNLSGPVCLFFSFLYFRRRIFESYHLSNLFKALILPICSQIGLIIARAPAYNNLTFSSEANFQLSAGYGPNQVSTLLGVGIVIIGISKIFQMKIYRHNIYDYIFATVSIGLALLTFARGGVLAPLFAIFVGVIISLRFKKENIKITKYMYLILIIIGLGYFSSIFTQGLIDSRYMALANMGVEQGFLSGRTKIMAIDLNIFMDNPIMGVGPGSAHHLRYEYGYGAAVAAHSEFTRMLSEHGIFGLTSLFSIMSLSIIEYYKRKKVNKILLACFSTFSLLTMFHSAFRIALAGYIYGLSYIILKTDRK